MVPYKKKPKNLGPVWCSSTKAGSCWSLASGELGLHEGTLQFCAVLAVGPRFRPSRQLLFPQRGDALPSMPDSTLNICCDAILCQLETSSPYNIPDQRKDIGKKHLGGNDMRPVIKPPSFPGRKFNNFFSLLQAFHHHFLFNSKTVLTQR